MVICPSLTTNLGHHVLPEQVDNNSSWQGGFIGVTTKLSAGQAKVQIEAVKAIEDEEHLEAAGAKQWSHIPEVEVFLGH